MTPSFSAEFARQRQLALVEMGQAQRLGDDYLLEVARARLAELADIARRLEPST